MSSTTRRKVVKILAKKNSEDIEKEVTKTEEQQCEKCEKEKCEAEKKEKKSTKKPHTEKKENKKDDEAEKKYNELEDKYLRLAAEYKNYQSRSQREKDELYTKSVADTVEKLLPVLDSVERAMALTKENDHAKDLSEGIALIAKMAREVFEKLGVEEIETVGKEFDANYHNAVMHIDDENYGENEIVEEFMKGYKIKDKVIRYSMVKVAN